MDVVKDGKKWVVQSVLGVLVYTDDGILFNSNIKEPLPGFIVIDGRGEPVEKSPPLFMERNGINHVLVGFDGGETVYAIYDPDIIDYLGEIYTRNFVEYTDGVKKWDPEEVKKYLEAKKISWGNVVVGGVKTKLLVVDDKKYFVPVPEGDKVVLYTLYADRVKPEYSMEEVKQFKPVLAVHVRPDLVKRIGKSST